MPALEPGQLRCKQLLRTAALYRVVESADEDHVIVEVVEAPGLPPGERLRMLRGVVEAMDLVVGED